MILQVEVIGVVGGLNIGVKNGIRRQLKARGPTSLRPYWTFLVLTALQIEDDRH